MASPSAIGSPLLQNQPKGHLWGPDAIMRRAGASDKSKDAFILELYINFVKRISFLDFSVWPWKRCEQPPCPVQPGPRDPRTTRTRRSGRGTREANIVPRNVGGTMAPRPSRFLCRSASRHVPGTYYYGTWPILQNGRLPKAIKRHFP